MVKERKKNLFTRRFWEEWRKKSLNKRIRDNSYFSSVCFEFREFWMSVILSWATSSYSYSSVVQRRWWGPKRMRAVREGGWTTCCSLLVGWSGVVQRRTIAEPQLQGRSQQLIIMPIIEGFGGWEEGEDCVVGSLQWHELWDGRHSWDLRVRKKQDKVELYIMATVPYSYSIQEEKAEEKERVLISNPIIWYLFMMI